MSQRFLVVQTTLVEQDEDGNLVSRHSEHTETVAIPGVREEAEQTRHSYVHWAYQGFQVARSGPLGLTELAAVVPQLTLLVLKTPQVEVLRAFYSALGVRFVEEQHGVGPRHYAGQLGSLVLEVYPATNAEDVADRSTRLGFGVEDLEGTIAALRDQGFLHNSPKLLSVGVRAMVRDPDGRAVELSTLPPGVQ